MRLDWLNLIQVVCDLEPRWRAQWLLLLSRSVTVSLGSMNLAYPKGDEPPLSLFEYGSSHVFTVLQTGHTNV